MNKLQRVLPFHYAWVIVFTGVLVLFSCLGLARFSFGMLLPSMSESLQLTYGQRGYLSSGYLIGYLLMVALVPLVNSRLGARLTITTGLLLVAGSMISVGFAHGFISVLLLYSLTGMGSGLSNVPVMALMSHWFAPGLRGRAAGLVSSGNGLGIILSGFLIPSLNGYALHEGWRYGWVALGIISLLVAILVWFLIRNDPAEMGLSVAGKVSSRTKNQTTVHTVPEGRARRRLLGHFGILYFIFGCTYMIYATFIVTTLVDERSFSESSAGMFWAWVGFLSLFSGAIFGFLSDKTSRKFGIMAALAVQTLAYFLASMDYGMLPVYASVILFGLSAWAIPSIMAASMGDYFGAMKAAWAFSIITFFFAVGQVLGPASAGILADVYGGFSTAFWMSATLTGVGVVIAGFLTKPVPD